MTTTAIRAICDELDKEYNKDTHHVCYIVENKTILEDFKQIYHKNISDDVLIQIIHCINGYDFVDHDFIKDVIDVLKINDILES